MLWRKVWVWILAIALLVSIALSNRGAATSPRTDLVVVGSIRTMDQLLPQAEAMAIRDGKIVFVGSATKALAEYASNGRVISLAPGQMVLPGLVDSHVHMLEAGLLKLACAVDDPVTREELFAAISNCAKARPEAQWFIGSGWPVALFDELGPRKEQLDQLIPNRPALMYGQDGHSAWLNSVAMKLAGIDRTTPDPPRGRIERDPVTKEPTGVLRESAVELVDLKVPPPSAATYQAGLKAAQQLLHGVGITLVQDANVNPQVLAAYSAAAHSGALTMKVVAAQATDPGKSLQQVEELVKLRQKYSYGRLTASSAKLFLDGVMEARTAALLQPYNNSPAGKDDRGSLNWPTDKLTAMVTELDAAGFQVHMHAIGDWAVREGLNAIAAARKVNPSGDQRHHIAHLELVDPEDVPRLAALGVTANFQPFWMYADPSIAESTSPLLGEERTARLYPIHTIKMAGAKIVSGSDWPVSTYNPFLAIEVGLTRKDPKNLQSAVWNPEQRVSLDTLLKAYTITGAWLNHRDQETGSLSVGKAADFIIIDRNLYGIPPEQVGDTQVLSTFVDGVEVFKK
uniref:Amidohydrolase 3 n=1 Tax=Cyanothece sp. (strain PCC 7425 / ATCC 29141) TaxID=395961 RepID=B8HNK5_CYAP4